MTIDLKKYKEIMNNMKEKNVHMKVKDTTEISYKREHFKKKR